MCFNIFTDFKINYILFVFGMRLNGSLRVTTPISSVITQIRIASKTKKQVGNVLNSKQQSASLTISLIKYKENQRKL
jgi:hypothetical protein